MISIVIPVLNEEKSLSLLHEQLKDVFVTLQRPYEIIFIDDGSTDGSWKTIQEISDKDKSRVRGVRLRSNLGKAHALAAGFQAAKGEVLVTMDADLQDDPQEIPNFLEEIDGGVDLVCGWKKQRKDPLTKTIPSKVFNATTRLISGVDLHDFNCGFKAFKKEVVADMRLYGELHRYIPVLASLQGFSISEIPVVHHPRPFGKSKYGWKRFGRGFLDLLTVIMLTRYAKRPGHLFGGIGLVMFLIGFFLCLYLTVVWFGGESIGKRPLLALGVMLLIISVQFISLGLIAELLIHQSGSSTNPISIRERTDGPTKES